MKSGNNWRGVWLAGFLLSAAATLLLHLTAHGQAVPDNANSREVSVFNFGQPSATVEGISREFSVFNFGQSPESLEAISREVSVFNFGEGSSSLEAISREVSMFNLGQSPSSSEATSREVSIFNFGQSPTSVEAISREVSVFNFGQSSASMEAISREVSVFNFGVPPIVFSVGSTNALKDVPNQVPFILQSVNPAMEGVVNLSLTLKTDDSRLQILGVTPVSPEVITGMVGSASVGGHPISFTLNPGAMPPTNRTLAYLNFQGITNLDSAIVSLTVTAFSATRSSGQTVPATTSNGQVILIVRSPMLFATNSPKFGITMYGIPGMTYAIESTTNLGPADWRELERFLESGSFVVVPGLTNDAPRQFYRAEQIGP